MFTLGAEGILALDDVLGSIFRILQLSVSVSVKMLCIYKIFKCATLAQMQHSRTQCPACNTSLINILETLIYLNLVTKFIK